MERFYKLARTDGWDFYTGKTIQYRENVGRDVTCPRKVENYSLCSDSVIHASRNPNDCFVGAKIPCSAYEVYGVPVVESEEKCGFRTLHIEREIMDLDGLFGWRYSEVVNPIHPFHIPPAEITEQVLSLLKEWASVRASVGAKVWASAGATIRDSVWASVGGSVRATVWDSVWDSVGGSVGAKVWASAGATIRGSVRDSVGVSVRDSVEAYIGSLFPGIKDWKYIEHEDGVYPFQAAVELWKMGLVPSWDRKIWRLHGGPDGKTLWEERN